MNKNKTFYITTTLPYVNGKPHIGFATEIIRADILARHKRSLLGKENVFFNTGTDEHGQKIFDKAFDLEIDPQEYTNKMSKNFKDLLKPLNISYDNFIRTTDKNHQAAAQKFWKLCDEAGYIYKKNYQAKYCVGCELEKQDSDLDENGFCPEHPGVQLELKDEENYFFRWSSFEKKLLDYYDKNPVLPKFRQNEIESFVSGGLRDFSISRLRNKMEWGIAVPNDKEHVMYVWFDALINYISTLGWGSKNEENFNKFWASEESTTLQICGKDNLRQQTAMWQAMLMAASEKDKRLRNTDNIFINGFISLDGKKISKSTGNVINPLEIVEKYGTDALRYFIARHFNHHEDSDFTWERFYEIYTADLVNGLGNLTNRVLAMSSGAGIKLENSGELVFDRNKSLLEEYDFNGELDNIWQSISDIDELISVKKPFKLIKSENEDERNEAKMVILSLLKSLWALADWLQPILPESSEKIKSAIKENKKPTEAIFPRLEKK